MRPLLSLDVDSCLGMHFPKPSRAILVCMSIYALLLALEAVVNVRINYLGKGSTWDIYPFAEAFWVLCSVLVVAFCTSSRRLALAVVALLFLDSFVDVCAMGTRCWWSGPPVLVEWKWQCAERCHTGWIN